MPRECSIGDMPVYTPIDEVSFSFNGMIDIKENATASILRGDEVMATGTITALNSSGNGWEEGVAVIAFDGELLPLGETYRLQVPAGAIYLQADPGTSTDELVQEFTVPENIGKANISIADGETVVSTAEVTFYYGTEIQAIDEPQMVLYREGMPVRSIPTYVSWDWNLGSVSVNCNPEIHFEQGVNYSLVLPAESVSALYRSDIVNEEARVDFVGGYTTPLTAISYVWCSLFDNSDIDRLDEVSFLYDRAITLSPTATIQLFEGSDRLVGEQTPTLTTEDGQWVVTADFGGIELSSEEGYSIVIPEGSIISAEGDVVVNSRSQMPIIGRSGVGNVATDELIMNCNGGVLNIENVNPGSRVTVYSADGKLIYNQIATSTTISLELPSKGIFIVTTGGKGEKVIN